MGKIFDALEKQKKENIVVSNQFKTIDEGRRTTSKEVNETFKVQQVNAKNVARKYKGFFDKEVYQTEVKKRMLWLQKLDFAELCARWPKEDV